MNDQRRAEILSAMHDRLETRLRWRRAQRAGAALLIIVTVGLAVGVVWRATSQTSTPPQIVKTSPPRGQSALVVVTNTVPPPEVYIDDAQLQKLLREANLPSGLISVAGKGTVAEMTMVTQRR
jgi:hypothetical protein